jgi:hypothetical protein
MLAGEYEFGRQARPGMNASLVITDGALLLEDRPVAFDQLGTALEALPAGTSVVLTLKNAGRRSTIDVRQVTRLIHAAGLTFVLMDVSDFVEQPTPGKP